MSVPVPFSPAAKAAVEVASKMSAEWHVYAAPAVEAEEGGEEGEGALYSTKLRCGDVSDLALAKYYHSQVRKEREGVRR